MPDSRHDLAPLGALILPTVGLVLLGAAGCASRTAEQSGDELMREAKFGDAIAAYESARREGSASPTLEAKLRDAQLGAQVAEAQRLHFEGKLAKSNQMFREIAAQVPDNPTVAAWLEKSQRDLSRMITQLGKEHLSVREYEQAIEAFKKALDLDPTNTDASSGLERTAKILQWRAEKGELLWREGLRAINEGSPAVAKTSIENSLDYTPDRPEAPEMLDDLRRTLADLRQRLAMSLEEKGQYYAAMQQYRLAQSTGGVDESLETAIQRTAAEAQADECVRRSDVALAKRDFDRAAKYLQDAKGLTKNPENLAAIDAKLFQVEEKRRDADAKAAVLLEFEGKLEEALEAMKALDARAPGYRDLRERMDRLARQIREAKEAAADGMRLQEEGDLENARLKFKAAVFLYPFLGDARARLKHVEEQLRAKAKSGAAPASAPASKP